MSKQSYAPTNTLEIEKRTHMDHEHEPTELQLLTQQLLKATEKNKVLQQQLLSVKEEMQRSKGSLEKLTSYIHEQEKKLSDLQQLNYASKKSQEQKWEIERQLEERQKVSFQQEEQLKILQDSLDESKQQNEQLERVILFLRERSEEFNLEAKQLKEDYQGALETILQLREQHEFLQQSLKQLNERLNQETQEKSDLSDELNLVHKQVESLKLALNDSQNLSKGQSELLEENQQLKRQQAEQTIAWDQTQHEIQTIRQTLLRTLKDSKKLEIQYQEVLNERISLANRAAQLQNLLDLQIDQTRICQEQLVEVQQRETRSKIEFEQQIQKMQQEHHNAIGDLSQQLAELENHNAALSAKFQETELDLLQGREEAISQLNAEYEKTLSTVNDELHRTKQELHEARTNFHETTQLREELKMEIQHLSHQLNAAQSDANEKENELRISQQHLAKKVKEVTILQDKIDLQQQRLDELSHSLAAAEQKSIDLEKVISDEQNRSTLFHDQLSESVKASEQKASKLEEKYLDLYQKWAATEARNKELEKLAERHLQMQSQMQQFFGGFAPVPHQTNQHMINDPLSISFPGAQPEIASNPFSEPKPVTEEKEAHIPFHNLLQPIKGNGRIKTNLFD